MGSGQIVRIRRVEALPADQNPALVYLAGLSPGSRRTMKGALGTLANELCPGAEPEEIPWHRVRYQHAQALRARLAEEKAPATVNKHLAALRGVLREAWRLDLMPASAYQKAVDVKDIRSERLPAGRELSMGELRALFSACAEDKSPAGARDAAMLALLYGGGLRRDEAVGLDLDDYQGGDGVRVRKGKGRKERMVYLAVGGQEAVRAWSEVRGDAPGALLRPVNKGGRILERRMTGQSIRLALKKRASQAGVGACSPHDLRRSFISHLLDEGADIVMVQKLAGHANVMTTGRYDRRGEESKRRAAGLLHVPYGDPETLS